ncbi:hypothetical protein [Tellurirhabdus rosea]|uniref:hypothetical protein n=1 Tax=Tellurirhabdus rosea TaxID=2674997 RepID=UPI0022501EC9|nr:hypothetical protein [Tellurirhabdus rosea]
MKNDPIKPRRPLPNRLAFVPAPAYPAPTYPAPSLPRTQRELLPDVSTHYTAYFVLCLVPLALLVAYLNRYGVSNIPQLDDYEVTINFIQDFRAAPGFGDKLGVLWQSLFITEHRMPLPKLIFWLSAEYGGELNYETLAWAGNLTALTGILALLSVIFRKSTHGSPLAFLPVPFLAVSVQYYELFTWPTCSFFYLFTTFFVIGAIAATAWSEQRPGLFVLGLLSAFLAAASYSNGLFVFPCLAMVLILQKRFRNLAPVLLLALPLFVLYFWNYTSTISTRFHGNTIPSLLTLAGTYIMPISQLRPWLSPLVPAAGLLLLTGIAAFALNDLRGWVRSLQSRKNARQLRPSPEQTIVLTAMAFLTITLVALAVKRSTDTMDAMLCSRYRYLSTLLAALCYLRVMQALQPKGGLAVWAFPAGMIPLSLALFGFAFPVNHSSVMNAGEPFKVASTNYLIHKDWCLYQRQEGFWRTFINQATADLEADRLWTRPEFFSDHVAEALTDEVSQPVRLTLSHPEPGAVSLKNEDWQSALLTDEETGTCLVLQNEAGRNYTLAIQRQPSLGLRQIFKPNTWVSRGFVSLVRSGIYPAGRYRVFLYEMRNGMGILVPTDAHLTL